MGAVFKEVLRLMPPLAWVALRDATVDHYLGDVHIKKGTVVVGTF